MAAPLKLRVCTWNVGNAPPPADLRMWLGTQSATYDIIAVGAQEANFKDTGIATNEISPTQTAAPSTPQRRSGIGDPIHHSNSLNSGVEEDSTSSSKSKKLRKIKATLLSSQRKSGKRLSGPISPLENTPIVRRGERVMQTAGRPDERAYLNTASLFEGECSNTFQADFPRNGCVTYVDDGQQQPNLRGSDAKLPTAEAGEDELRKALRSKPAKASRGTKAASNPGNVQDKKKASDAKGPTECGISGGPVTDMMGKFPVPKKKKSSGNVPNRVHAMALLGDSDEQGGDEELSWTDQISWGDAAVDEAGCPQTMQKHAGPGKLRTETTSRQMARVPSLCFESSQDSEDNEDYRTSDDGKVYEEHVTAISSAETRDAETSSGRFRALQSLWKAAEQDRPPSSTREQPFDHFDQDEDIPSIEEVDLSEGDPANACGVEHLTIERESISEMPRRQLARAHTAHPVAQPTAQSRKSSSGIPSSPGTAASNAPFASPSGRKFSKYVQNSMGKEYMLVAKEHLMEIKLMLFIHRKHRSRIGKVETTTEATGIGNVVGNKGGVAVKVMLEDTSFCFVSSHLAAHEGTKFLQQRNTDVLEIMRNIERTGRMSGLPAIHQFSHFIWMGDLNYRIDLERGVPAAITWNHDQRWEFISKAAKTRDFKDLIKCDELRLEMEKENVFVGFQEGEITFRPTFKVSRGLPFCEYQRLRLPAYCDRVLWHSLPCHKEDLSIVKYASIESYNSSDHKPVYAVFNLRLPKRLRRYGHPVPINTIKCTLDFKRLRLRSLAERKNESGGLNADDIAYDILEDGALSVRAQQPPGGLMSPFTPDASCTQDGGGAAGLDGEDGGPGVGNNAATWAAPPPASTPATTATTHTRRGVRVEFFGGGVFLRDKTVRTEVPLRNGQVRECGYHELPKIPLAPLESLTDLNNKYVTIAFTRWGSKVASSCLLPLVDLVQNIGWHSVNTELDLRKYGRTVACVEVEAELCISMECYIDANNNVVKVRR